MDNNITQLNAPKNIQKGLTDYALNKNNQQSTDIQAPDQLTNVLIKCHIIPYASNNDERGYRH